MRYLKGTLSVVVFFLTLAVGYAQSSAELRKQREQLNKEIERLNQSLKTTSSDRSLSLKEVNALNTQLRSEEHTSELQSLMRISYAVFCLQKKIQVRHKKKAP